MFCSPVALALVARCIQACFSVPARTSALGLDFDARPADSVKQSTAPDVADSDPTADAGGEVPKPNVCTGTGVGTAAFDLRVSVLGVPIEESGLADGGRVYVVGYRCRGRVSFEMQGMLDGGKLDLGCNKVIAIGWYYLTVYLDVDSNDRCDIGDWVQRFGDYRYDRDSIQQTLALVSGGSWQKESFGLTTSLCRKVPSFAMDE